jgi:hypothetical protein
MVKRAVAVVLALVLGACGDGESRPVQMAKRRVEKSYPGGLISLVDHQQPSGEGVVCGYARARGATAPAAFIWRRGHLLSPADVEALPDRQIARLCGPDYALPRRATESPEPEGEDDAG